MPLFRMEVPPYGMLSDYMESDMNNPSRNADDRQIKTENIEGALMRIPQQWDPVSGIWISLYPETLMEPHYTPRGERIMLSCEDACQYADLQPGVYKDCGSCNHYRQAPGSQLGVCDHPAHRRKEKTEEVKK